MKGFNEGFRLDVASELCGKLSCEQATVRAALYQPLHCSNGFKGVSDNHACMHQATVPDQFVRAVLLRCWESEVQRGGGMVGYTL